MSVFADPACLAPFYPAALLLPLVPLDAFVLLAWCSHLGIGAAGVQHHARVAGGSRLAGLGAGIVWLCSTTCVAALVDGQLDMLAVLAWLPWALVGAWRLADGAPAARWIVGVALCLGAIGLGSHARFAAFAFIAVAIFGLVLFASGRRWRPLLSLGVACGLGLLLGAPMLLPAILEVAATRSGAPPDGPLVGQALSAAGLTGLLYPRALVIDERWYHVGVGLLLCGVGLRGDRRRGALLITAALLLALGMGLRGPLGWALGPVLWAFYPVETGAAALALPFLAVAIGLSLDQLPRLARDGAGRLGIVCLGIGALVVGLGWSGSRGLYLPSVEGMHALDTASLVQGGLAVVALAALLLLLRRVGPARAAALGLALLTLDGLAYAWRVQTAIPSESIRPSEWLAGPAALQHLESRPGERVAQLPLVPIRDFERGLPADELTHTGHGWGHNPGADPTRDLPAETRDLLRRPVHRNSGSATGWSHVGGRAKVPPMPWSAVIHELGGPDPSALPPTDGPRLLRLLRLLHVRHILFADGQRAEVPDPQPAAWVTSGQLSIPDVPSARRRLLDGSIDSGATTVLLDSQPPVPATGPGAPGAVLDWSPGRWSVAVPTDGILTLAARYHPGWQAQGGGQPLDVVRANLVQVGVVVPPGVDTVSVMFVAPGASTGATAGLFGLILCLLVGLGQRSANASATPVAQGSASPAGRAAHSASDHSAVA